ncbi:MAG TPA: hypothetical protein DE313_01175 [Ruminococcus sp.]|nr:hypothetical protein [Ruminococcus sp.]
MYTQVTVSPTANLFPSRLQTFESVTGLCVFELGVFVLLLLELLLLPELLLLLLLLLLPLLLLEEAELFELLPPDEELAEEPELLVICDEEFALF